MSGTLITVLSFAFVLGVLVFVHELGHFLAAKRIGIRVLKFQLGFNPTVLSVRRGDTEYSIGALPLGGYVKMAGENPDEPARGGPTSSCPAAKWERFQVLIMGPVMNLVLAVVLTAVVLYQGAERLAYETQPVVVGAVTANSPAAGAGIQAGDRITAVAGRNVATWEDFYIAVGTKPNREVPIAFVRDGIESSVNVTPKTPDGQPLRDRRHRRAARRAPAHPIREPWRARRPRGPEGRTTSWSRSNGEPITFSSNLKDAISKHPEQADLAVDSARRRSR